MMATILEQLRAAGAADDEAARAVATLAKVLPLGRAIVLDDQIVDAARRGDMAQLRFLLAPEEEPDEKDRQLLREIAEGDPEDRELIPLDEVKRELELPA